jgi:hypothetical protein
MHNLKLGLYASGHVLIEIILVQTNYTFAVFWKHSVIWQLSFHELSNHAREEEDK